MTPPTDPDDLRTRIATIVHDKDTVKCCDECTISSPGPWDYEVADAIIEALKADYVIVDTRGCEDLWHKSTGAPFQCPRCAMEAEPGTTKKGTTMSEPRDEDAESLAQSMKEQGLDVTVTRQSDGELRVDVHGLAADE